MATESNSDPPTTTTTTTIKEEEDKETLPTSQPPTVKGEPQELSATTSTEPIKKSNSDGAALIKSVDELHSLSTVLHAFRCRWDELQKHLDFIQTAIKDLDPSPPNLVNHSNNLQQNHLAAAEIVPVLLPPPTQQTPAPAASNADNATTTTAKQSELEYLCQTMCSRGLRKYIITHLSSDAAQLRGEVTAALKIAPKPAKLVFECIGRFFLQGSKAYTKDSPMIPARQASVLILEFFLLSGGGAEIDPSVKEEADLAAIAWRKRLISEGGVSKTNAIDARGLLLFIGSFGIPNVFRNEEVRDMVRLSNPMEIADSLRQSRALLTKIPEIIEGTLKNGMKAAAVDIAFTFGLEDKFPPHEILTSFLRDSKEAWKKTRRESQGSTMVLKEANRKHLAALKSVRKCLEDHKIDPLKFLPGWQINEKMTNLEKDIADLEKKLLEEKMTIKRKQDELESSKLSRFLVEKRSRPSHGLQEQRTATHVDSKSSYDRLTPINLSDGIQSGHNNSYYAASSVAMSLPDNILGTMAGSGSGMLAARVGSGLLTGSNGVLSTSSFPGVHRDILVDKVGPMHSSNYPSYGWPGIGDAAFSDRFSGQSYARQPASIGINDLYGSSPSLEGFAGLPKSPATSAANRSSASDLYQFADTIVESSYYGRGSHKSGTNPVLPAHHHSSYPN